MKQFKLHESQQRVNALIRSDPIMTSCLLYGPARSGKTTELCSEISGRAMMFPGSKHGIFRRTRKACMLSLYKGSMPETIEKLWPGYMNHVKLNTTDGTMEFHNGSIIHFDGIDPNEPERLLGYQYSTAWINECNQVEDWGIVDVLASRLAEPAEMVDPSTGQPMLDAQGQPIVIRPLLLLDCNPDLKSDWDYRAFVEKVNPVSGKPWPDPAEYRRVFMPAKDNEGNLSPNYLTVLANRYDGSPAMEERFLKGLWRDENPDALFKKSMFTYCEPKPKEAYKRIVVGVDPSGSAGNNSDYTGIIVVGIDWDGKAYVLEDASIQGVNSEKWAARVIEFYDAWNADYIVAEKNYGGDMVRTTIRSARRNIEPVLTTASRAKLVRAGPVAQQYKAGNVVHAGSFKELEAQMCDYNEDTKKSPDRMDALVWALTYLLNLNGDQKENVPGGRTGRGSGRRR